MTITTTTATTSSQHHRPHHRSSYQLHQYYHHHHWLPNLIHDHHPIKLSIHTTIALIFPLRRATPPHHTVTPPPHLPHRHHSAPQPPTLVTQMNPKTRIKSISEA
ncbi:hypothetical protein E2C01_030627 [Portunus trituberculatus]|uniref:Uncharacterized protein n=1 Tax=Portunus trituberculatus TaxID=210409 RepID=A0A5B7EW96_PORTR|nr:hypothetical protein [Portunus trituberculatus]